MGLYGLYLDPLVLVVVWSAARPSVAELLVVPGVGLVVVAALNIGFDGRVVYDVDLVVLVFLPADSAAEDSSDVAEEDSFVDDFCLPACLIVVRL